MNVLTEHQQRVAAEFLAKERLERRHLVVALSGAHAYGFPSPDSDLDLKAVHLEPTRDQVGLFPRSRQKELITVIEGVEVDYSSNEVAHVLRGVVAGNGNFVERLLGHLPLEEGPELAALRPLVTAALSRRVFRHYQGFARQQQREWEGTGYASAKKLLYVLRTTLTGVHLLREGAVAIDVNPLLEPNGLADAKALIEAKTKGEKAPLPDALSLAWRDRVSELFGLLERAHEQSVLPAEPSERAVAELDAWLLETRKRFW